MKKEQRESIIKAGRVELAAWLRAAEKHGKIYYSIVRTRKPSGDPSNRIVLRTIRFVKGRPELSLLWPGPPVHMVMLSDEYARAQDIIAKDWGFSYRRRAFVTDTGGMGVVADLVHDLAKLAGVATEAPLPSNPQATRLYISRVYFEAFSPS